MALPCLPSRNVTLVSEDHAFLTPVKLIKSIEDMMKWDRSEAYYEYLGFIYVINDALKGTDNTNGSKEASPNINKTIALLDNISQWVDNIPPVDQSQTTGNAGFRIWYNKLKEQAIELLQKVLPSDVHRAIPEIMVYLEESFGDSYDIKYGSQHEISFVMFLCSLYKIGFLTESDFAASACKLFVRYLHLVRKLQETYKLQPVSFSGAWGLDDYQFVPFIWGSAQLIGNTEIQPCMLVKPEIADTHADNYMFMGCIQHINKLKSGPFGEHSNQLWSVSGVNNWFTVNGGLVRMYRSDILGKFSVVQNIVFGSLFTLKQAEFGASIRSNFTNGRPNCWSPSDITSVPTSTTKHESRNVA
ncbi:serine/threonine-protein phosphatase 2A activator-like [Anthonomus grandis grandis]|uniref:serine/threonine-protein phosphatase 2A activator-like n=1 Tax=Anthonomus grandis grandis TaxID=2921223 RepID=UPI00216542D2|nr:serine/threonine-protein phosphatase 2A activator-like [Anthonomus grandis grandis]